MREAFQVGHDLLGVPVDHADRLEHAVTALCAQLPDTERGGRSVDLREGVGEVAALHVGGDGIDHECKAPCHDPSLDGGNTHRLIALQLSGRAA